MFLKKLEFLDNSPQSTHMYVMCVVMQKQVRKFVLFLPNLLVLFCVLCYLSQPYLNISI